MNAKMLGCLLMVATACLRGWTGDWYVAENGRDADDAGSESDPFASIAFAVSKAGNNDTVHVAEGTYSLAVETVIEKPVVVEGSGDRAKTILKKVSGVRPFTLNDDGAVIRNLLIDGSNGGWGPGQGGGVRLNKGTVDQCDVYNCFSANCQSGGGIYMVDGLVTRTIIRNCQAVNSALNVNGAGICMTGGTVDNCLIRNCGGQSGWCDKGGGIYVNGSECVVVNCTVAGCRCATGGGGIYLNSGKVCNTLIYDNTVSSAGEPNFHVGSNPKENVRNCCTDRLVGENGQETDVVPFDANWQLDPAKAACCIDKGDNGLVLNDLDVFGGTRIYNGATVDIGAHELQSTVVTLSIESSGLSGVDSLTATLTAVLSGADAANYDFLWYFDGADTVGATGAQVSMTFGSGAHGVRLVAVNRSDKEERHEAVKPLGWIIVYPMVITVGETAGCPDINSAVAVATQDGMTVRIPEGTHNLGVQINLNADVTLAGIGNVTNVILKRVNNAFSGSTVLMSHQDAVISNLTFEGNLEWAGHGGAINMSDGRVEGCVIRKFSGGNSGNGGGINMSGGVVTRSVIRECQTVGVGSGSGCGVYMSGGRLDNSLVIDNKPTNKTWGNLGGGVYMCGKDAVVANCVIANNACRNNGGLYRSANGGRVYNTIIIGNTLQYTDDTDGTVSDIGYALGAKEMADEVFTSICTPEAVGTGCVTGDPLFRDAANGDFRLAIGSPCVRKGVWLDWMTVDFAGNRRVTRPGAKVDIGIYQSDRGLVVIIW